MAGKRTDFFYTQNYLRTKLSIIEKKKKTFSVSHGCYFPQMSVSRLHGYRMKNQASTVTKIFTVQNRWTNLTVSGEN